MPLHPARSLGVLFGLIPVSLFALLSAPAWAGPEEFALVDVTVKVTDSQGKPVSGAAVKAFNETWGILEPAGENAVLTTDEKGTVKTRIWVSTWSFFAATGSKGADSHPGSGLFLVKKDVPITKSTEVALVPDCETPVQAQTISGEPIAGAEVQAMAESHRGIILPLRCATTDPDGKAVLATNSQAKICLLLACSPQADRDGYVLWQTGLRTGEEVRFAPKAPQLATLRFHLKDLNGNPTSHLVEFLVTAVGQVDWPVWSPAETGFTLTDGAAVRITPGTVELRYRPKVENWQYFFLPTEHRLLPGQILDLNYGGSLSYHTWFYPPAGQLWLRFTDAAGHNLERINDPDRKSPEPLVKVTAKDGTVLFDGKASVAYTRMEKELPQEQEPSYELTVNLGPLGTISDSGKLYDPEHMYVMDTYETEHFVIHAPLEFSYKMALVARDMESVWRQYETLCGFTPDLSDKKVDVYFQLHLGGAGGWASDKDISVWLSDLIQYQDSNDSPDGHLQSILYHEFTHVVQGVPNRGFYPTPWYGESVPQNMFNVAYGEMYGEMARRRHQGKYLRGNLDEMRKREQELAAGRDYKWEPTCLIWDYARSRHGDKVFRDYIFIANGRGHYEWLSRSGRGYQEAALAMYQIATGENYAWLYRLGGNPLPDAAVKECVEIGTAPDPPYTPPGPKLAFVKDWLVIGPWPDSDHTALTKDLLGGEASAAPKEGDKVGDLTWKRLVSKEDFVDLVPVITDRSDQIAYAFTTLESPADMDAFIGLGTDDGCKVFLNGEQVYFLDVVRGADPDQIYLKVRLKKGTNTLLLKINQRWGGWGFYLRIWDKEGNGVGPSATP